MTEISTETQTAEQLELSRKLSESAERPPAQIPGYRLERFVGAGAFGQIWAARNLNTGRKVAVKFYLHRGGVNWSLLTREVKSLVQLSSDRSVVQVLEVGWEADPPFYIMEWVAGGSLEDRLSEQPQLGVDDAVAMIRQILVGLIHCHSKGVLHCDLKPANVLLGDDDEPRLTDFGQSRFSTDQTPALGTLFYMAPEQADLSAVPDARWDVYAAGAILFRMLTGRVPHRDEVTLGRIESAETLASRLAAYRNSICAAGPPDWRRSLDPENTVRPEIDRGLARILKRSLSVLPEQRYPNVPSMLADLDRRERNRRRRPILLMGIVGPLLILLATLFFGSRSISAAKDQTVRALRSEASTSNRMAAAYAAKSLESEIARYFDLIRSESNQDDFRRQLTETLNDESVGQSLDSIAGMKSSAATQGNNPHRSQLLQSKSRQSLENLLSKRLQRYSGPDISPIVPRLATMFVTDPRGTIIAVAFDNPISADQSSVGRNFAYRTYFHGGREDFDAEQTQAGKVDPLNRINLSSAFPSTATKRWKVAVSAPIWFDDDTSGPIDALFVATINLGDFSLLDKRADSNKYAVVVDARPGNTRGTILQHPSMESSASVSKVNTVSTFNENYQIAPDVLDQLLDGSLENYVDPFPATSTDQDESSLQKTAGSNKDDPWIAAMQPVYLPTTSDQSDEDTESMADLLVLVQYRLAAVEQPVQILRQSLIYEGIAAIVSIFVVTLTLWAFVRRQAMES